MKGRKHHKSTGGAESAKSGTDEAAEDIKSKPERYDNSRVEGEAEERKRGGRAKKKHEMKVHGRDARANGGRAPRKSGGRTGSNMNPLSSAHKGSSPKGHKTPGDVAD